MRWIVTDDIYAETWRRLLEFANVELTYDEIARRHGSAATDATRNNYRKQAVQARVCVLQAKEYFDAARSTSLFTSPNHAYYGAVALASLTMLILGDGTKSLDRLRSDNKNNHHGLDLTIGCNAKTATNGVVLLEQTFVEILKYGHFANWYQTLTKRGTVYAMHRKSHGSTGTVNYLPAGGYDVPSFASLQGKKKSIIDTLKYLPDLEADLQRFGVSTARSRTSHEINEDASGNITHTWRIHGARSQIERDALLEKFSVSSRFADSISCFGTEDTTGGIVRLQMHNSDELGLTWPTARETLNHDTISYADAPETHEIVDLYLIAYQLSMLSRYFPDIWISSIESQCRGAKLIERTVGLILKKLPILTLSMLAPEEIVISTHREPWKD